VALPGSLLPGNAVSYSFPLIVVYFFIVFSSQQSSNNNSLSDVLSQRFQPEKHGIAELSTTQQCPLQHFPLISVYFSHVVVRHVVVAFLLSLVSCCLRGALVMSLSRPVQQGGLVV
jgi:hypothetical protein